jgi:replication factor C subunit 3/5
MSDEDEYEESRKHLPFVERFRPRTLDEIMSHDDTIHILKNFIKQHNIPPLLFYGPPGTGKTSTIEAFVHELYGSENVEYMTMSINASEERGIEVIRNKVKNFVSTFPIRNSKNAPAYKFVILDEADAMTFDAQGVLKRVIEFYAPNARFCLICNCNKKVNPALQSRCTIFNFPPLDYDSVKKTVDMISNKFNITVTDDGIETIWKLSNGDMRKVMHTLQVMSINNNVIDSDKVTTFQKYPTHQHATILYDTFMKKELRKSLALVKKIINDKGYSLMDIITEMTHKLIENITNNNVDVERGTHLLIKMRDVEMNIIATSDTDIQLCSLVAIFSL